MERLFLTFSVDKLRQLESRIQHCLEILSPEQVWWRASEENNSVANLVLHLSGNVRQWIVATVGGMPGTRNRDAEFAARGGDDITELRAVLSNTLEEAVQVIEKVTAPRLTERVQVQGFDVSVLEAIYHAVEHFAMHTGQIIYITKSLRKVDLGFYNHLKAAANTEKTP